VKRSELTIVTALAVVGLIVAFWMMVISPKRNEAASLKDDIDQLHSSLEQAQQAAAAGQQARKSFPIDYRRLVVLGKAVPEDGEQASLLVQLQRLADVSGVGFQSIDLSQTSSSTPTSSTAAPAAPATPSSSTSSGSLASAPPAESTPSATEASAATLPIGASVGPAGLPVMPYDLKFTGDYFQIADFLKRLDGMVHTRQGLVDVHGRLLTVDALMLAPVQSTTGPITPVPTLTAELTVTTYLTPADQGVTAGATPGGPALATPTPVAGTPTSSTSPSTSTSGPVPGAAGPTTNSP
jgi:Tfp pilus assembly protein PilO